MDESDDKLYHESFQIEDNAVPIYFDHKLATNSSTYQKILALGVHPLATPESTCKLNSLITNCDTIKYISGDENFCEKKIDDLKHNSEDNDACPVAFYKYIDYTYNKHLLDKKENFISQYRKLTVGGFMRKIKKYQYKLETYESK